MIRPVDRKGLVLILTAWSISILFILAKGSLMNQAIHKGINIDLVIIITVYLLASQSVASAGIFIFCMGFLIDVLSGGVLGFFTLLYLLVYIAARMLSHPIDLLSPGGRVTIVFIAVIFKELLMVALLTLFSFDSAFDIKDLLGFILSALVTCLLSPVVFYFFRRIEGTASSVEREF
ncbi:rod shape-determining protein MreD [Thermodesulfobacteriota bacterium]